MHKKSVLLHRAGIAVCAVHTSSSCRFACLACACLSLVRAILDPAAVAACWTDPAGDPGVGTLNNDTTSSTLDPKQSSTRLHRQCVPCERTGATPRVAPLWWCHGGAEQVRAIARNATHPRPRAAFSLVPVVNVSSNDALS